MCYYTDKKVVFYDWLNMFTFSRRINKWQAKNDHP